ncbi:MAG: chromosomal replication initiator protein DnaA [Clostridia bacterium]|nr:chromosomal replication initiator protein DnaA [Clostridia bacterium]
MTEKDNSFNLIWEKVIELLEEKFSLPIMDLWFNCLYLGYLSDRYAVLISKEDYKRDIVQSKYCELISDCFKEVLGFDVMTIIYSTEKYNGDVAPIMNKIKSRMDSGLPLLVGLDSLSETAPSFQPGIPKTEEELKNDENEAEIEPKYFETKGSSEDGIRSRYTFDNFIVGSSNNMAYGSCVAVSNNPARDYNPLFIYGNSGLGKTHLLYALTNALTKNFPDFRVVYIKGEEFLNELVDSITYKNTDAFRKKFRTVDVLIIDDIQFIANRPTLQEEIFHTFNELYENGKQIVFTSDRPPKDINPLEVRVRSRFEQGLIVDIQPPDLELRIAILKRKTQEMGISVPNEVLSFLGDKLDCNIRQIEGVIKKLRAATQISGKEITLELARNSINDIINGIEPVEVTVDKILAKTARKYGVSVEDIKGQKRNFEIAWARHVSIYIIRELTDMSYPALGKLFNRNHATAISSCNAVDEKRKESSSFDSEISDLINDIRIS